MSRTRSFLMTLAAILASEAGSHGAFVLTGSTTRTGGASYNDPTDPSLLISYAIANVTHIDAPVAGDQFSQIFASQIAGWTLSYGGGIAGSLNINSNDGSLATKTDGSKDGVLSMSATYTPDPSDPKNLTFIQYFTTVVNSNDPSLNKYVQKIDNGIGNLNGLPTYYNNQLMINRGLTFLDYPQDPMPSVDNSYTLYNNNYYTYMCTFDSTAKTLTVYDGWHWGSSTGAAMPFVIISGSIPEPASCICLTIGLGISCFFGRRTILLRS